MNIDIFSIQSEAQFNEACLATFKAQLQSCEVYASYVQHLGCYSDQITHYKDIPFLPVQFFKTQRVFDRKKTIVQTFSSSGTTGMVNAQHHVADLGIYETSFRAAFKQFYGDIKDIALLALLPNYQERTGSSLIYMVDDLIKHSQQPESNYFLYDHENLYQALLALKKKGTKTVLIGVTYALLDFIAQYNLHFPALIIMETGGMKGKRKEMIREEVHALLKEGFGVSQIHSEYGMTELLSQGYSLGEGIFQTPSWMRILIRDTNDPLSLQTSKNTGAINVIDLANQDSCAFIATQDLGRLYKDNQFEVLGRFDQADIRGCNLLVQ